MSRSISVEELTQELRLRKLIEPGALISPEPSNARPWFISIVLGLAGWLAGIFALCFIGLLFKPDTAPDITAFGACLLLVAFGLYVTDRHNQFLDQLALALSIAGQFALVWAAFQAKLSESTVAALVTVMQIIILFAMPNALAKTLAAFFACCAWALTIRFAWWGELDFFSSAHQTIDLPTALFAWLAVWAPVIGGIHSLIRTERAWIATNWRRIARPALSGALVSLCVATWLSEPLDSLQFWQQDPLRSNWIVLWPLLGALGSLFAATCAFRLRSRALIGTAIVFALLHVAQFYYLLGTTLLIKSCIMVVIGFVMLGVARSLRDRSEVIAP